MTRTITASVLALTIGLTSISATPAQASHNDVGKIVAGAVALFIIGKAIQNSNNSRADVSRRPQTPVTRPAHNNRRYSRRLPQQCFFRASTGNGNPKRGVYGKACLREEMPAANRLPQACVKTVRVRHGRRAQVYGARCLRSHGYRDAYSRNRNAARHH